MRLRDAVAAVAAGEVVQKEQGQGVWVDMPTSEVLLCAAHAYQLLNTAGLDYDDFATRLKPLSVTINGTEYSIQKSCLTVALPEEFYFNGDGKVYSRVSQVPSRYAQGRTQFGNRFATREAAETAANLVKVLLDTMKG